MLPRILAYSFVPGERAKPCPESKDFRLNQSRHVHISLLATCLFVAPQAVHGQTNAGDAAAVVAPNAPAVSAGATTPTAQKVEADGDFEVDAAPAAHSSHAQPGTAAAQPPAAAATAPSQPTSTATAAPPAGPPASATKPEVAQASVKAPVVDVTGYAQLQYESHQDSEDQLRQGGSLLNQNRFLVRRMRVLVSRRFQYSGFLVELDGNTTNGLAFGLQRAEGMLFYQGNPAGQPALVELTAGMFLLPFGYEVPESPKTRWFIERSTASRAFFPTEVDVGARLHGAWRFLRYGVALTNGEPKGTKATNFQLQDPNKAKDVMLRVGADVPAGDTFRVTGGVSYLAGKGFSAGQDATKARITWTDTNQNAAIDPGELVGVAGAAAVPAQNFRRWAVGADLHVYARSRIGWTTVFAEAVAATNLDRGLYVADPIAASRDVREFGWHVGFTQELTRYAIVGFRYDTYDPDSDLIDSRGGQFLPTNQVITTYSPMIGLTLPDRARLVFQYDFIRDHLARDHTGVPTDFANDTWTLRLQVNL
jgi:hypothetical protein